MMDRTRSVDWVREGAVAYLFLNRPAESNALTAGLLDRLLHLLDRAANDESVRVIVLAGRGDVFCAGVDPGARKPDRRSPAPDLSRILAEAVTPVVLRLREIERPVIAAAHGVAAGAGVGLLAAADIAIAERGTRFALDQIGMGLAPEAGASWFLPRLIGLARTRALAMTGEVFEADEAREQGLIWRVVEEGTLMEAAGALAQELAGRPPQTLSLVKRMLEATTVASLEEQLQVEANVQRRLGRTEDHREAAAALAEGRTPVFRGK
ncbi:MAG: enoyl-CoA hydratase-related protein [Alphaproteobacteria bacterium]|nr:enoyl-CoA hydratase-related protein [Alphaproteobacteria bacterium]MDX5369579.1 enoyl-CoA hydratase-related protein [Alphaproteobacteria bacterium]MDX5464233.1 enoyl-CoA hydratase-related protein [Alphaproteobacteria bacterium]